MKFGFFTSLLVCAWSLSTLAAGQEGNGGFGLKCGNKVELLELYEAREVHHLNVDLGAPNLPIESKIKIVLDRLAKWMPAQAAGYQKMANEFFNKHGEILGERVVIIANKKSLSEGKQPPLDIGNTIIPKNCDLVAMARNYDEAQSPTKSPRAYLFSDSYNLADNDSKTILRLHELFLMFGQLGAKPADVRYVLAHLVSKEFDNLTYENWLKIASLALHPEYQGVFLDSKYGMGFYPNGKLKSASPESRRELYAKWPLKRTLPGTQYIYMPELRNFIEFNSEGQANAGDLYPGDQPDFVENEKYQFRFPLLGRFFATVTLDKKSDWVAFKLDGENRITSLVTKYNGKPNLSLTLANGTTLYMFQIAVVQQKNTIQVYIPLRNLPESELSALIGGPFKISEWIQVKGTINADGDLVELKIPSDEFRYRRSNFILNPSVEVYDLNSWTAISKDRFVTNPLDLRIFGVAAHYGWNVNKVVNYAVKLTATLTTQVGSSNFCVTTEPTSEDYTMITRNGQTVSLPRGGKYTITLDGAAIPLNMGCTL